MITEKIHRLDRERVLAQERARIARDMHDDIGASLTRISLLSEVAKLLPSTGSESAPVTRISDIARDAVDKMGELVWATNPKFDTLDNLTAYLREYSARFLADARRKGRLEFPQNVPAFPVGSIFRRNVVMILKEGLNNAAKHSGATEVGVSLDLHPGRLELTITDNGCGFDETDPRRFGNGLNNLRERIQALKGTFSVASQPGAGTRLAFRLPLPPEKA